MADQVLPKLYCRIVELLLFASLEVGLDRFCIALELQPTSESAYPEEVTYPLENPRPKTE